MGENLNLGTNSDPLLSRKHVVRVLSRAGFDFRQIDTVLGGLEFPSPYSRVLLELSEHGISREWLIDQLGGSP